ncbi:CPn0927/CPn0928 family alpha/beta hydrolase fold protein [Chlamydia ibidis]|nr:CPn0927/CPn0928 family alpha/beta hydrolase fold protein [Chlamydia ibidis]
MSPNPKVFMFSSKAASMNYCFQTRYPRFSGLIKAISGIFKAILRIVLCIPLGLIWLLERICQNLIVPSAGGIIVGGICQPYPRLLQAFANQTRQWKQSCYVSSVDRVPIQIDNLLIDAIQISFPEAKPDRWMLVSLGNGESFETRILVNEEGGPFHQEDEDWILAVARKAKANVLMFNYPGVMCSKGYVSKETLVQAYLAAASYLTDCNNGPKAKEIIAYGYSLGSLVQSEALQRLFNYKDRQENWFVIKDRGPRSTMAVGYQWLGKLGYWITRITNWGIDSEGNSRALPVPELSVQGSDKDGKLIGDGLFNRETCFAAGFLDNQDSSFVSPKSFVCVPHLLHQEGLTSEAIDKISSEISTHFEGQQEKEEQ